MRLDKKLCTGRMPRRKSTMKKRRYGRKQKRHNRKKTIRRVKRRQAGGVFPYMPRDADTVFLRSVGGVPVPVSADEADAIADGREDVSE